MTNELSTERAIETLYTVRAYYASLTAGYPKGKDRRGIGDVMCSEIANSCLKAIQALEQQPSEDCVSRSELQKTMDSLPLFRFVNNDHEEADDYYNCESVDMVIRNLPSVTPRRDLAETSQDCISRQAALDCFEQTNTRQGAKYAIETLPSVKPKYTDEEIDKAQAVEQAYVDKMVELAVEESRKKWLNSFDTSSATKCFEAVNLLKQRLEGEE